MVSFSGDLSGNIDLDLARIGRARRVVLAVPQFSGLRRCWRERRSLRRCRIMRRVR